MYFYRIIKLMKPQKICIFILLFILHHITPAAWSSRYVATQLVLI